MAELFLPILDDNRFFDLTALKSVFINFPKQRIFALTEDHFGEDNQNSNKNVKNASTSNSRMT